ncbi:bifunctional diaminohydroxyphosphoribosylaminopyrimidine deaminase/5-amino-6-(5-phosphoribosylamino)uracil reductase RibD [Hydrogenimonas thermophila]|uniref:Riboflavin biosynthesis protein RibD n=2 Tax=Hydrogenimonas thermophila TaxID=223786 RepID=A0A1I5LVD3_9BACT|nr:bifunctional diaminohydroxyphosphoribosylaminopyrimidine deaminase/5-amino-6-(5-phosphoribosylamino)uracil reductase RibD [Hydrogenimonas thermophila]SFP00721.1 diaminohydroxyphosphoribosylaminopyrimidine deaminase [Hydrogenimonas thermophila]
MRLAISEAWKYQLLTYPNPAVGAVVVGSNGELLAVNAHQEAGKAHAEVLAIRDAYVKSSGDCELAKCDDAHILHSELAKRAGTLFFQSTIYVTLEPCSHTGKTPACADLISKLGFKRVVIGAMDPNPKAAGGAERLKHKGIEVITGIEREACEVLIEPFLKWQTERFIFLKLAQSMNGVIDGGIISCESSRVWVHKVRDKIDLLAIGGNTVRVDRPILDSRLINGKAPDIAILTSNPDSIDRTIPLFKVPNRKVNFINSVSSLPKSGLVMVEGGSGTLQALQNEIDWMVLFITPFVKEGNCYNGIKNFELLHQTKIDRDAMLWLKVKDE